MDIYNSGNPQINNIHVYVNNHYIYLLIKAPHWILIDKILYS